MNNWWDRGDSRQRGRDVGIVGPPVIKGARGGAVTFSGQVQIDVCLPGQNSSFVTLEVVWAHVRMQVAPVVVGNGRIARITGGVVRMADGTHVRSKGWSLDAGETGHTTELLSRRWFWGFELPMDIIRGGGCEWKRRMVRVGTGERCADVLLPEFAKLAELCLPGGHSGRSDSSRCGRELIGHIDLSEIHEDVLVDDAVSVMIGEERRTVRGDAGNDVGVVEAHEAKGRGETLLIIRFAGVGLSGSIV